MRENLLVLAWCLASSDPDERKVRHGKDIFTICQESDVKKQFKQHMTQCKNPQIL